MQIGGQGGSEPKLGYRYPRFCRLPGLVRNVGTGPPGQAPPRRKGWNPSYKMLKSHQIKGGPHWVRKAVPRTVCRHHAKAGGTLPGVNGVNGSTHSAGCGGKSGTLDGGTSTGVIRRKATGVAGRSASPCSVGICHRRDVGFCNIPRNLPTGPVNGLPCPLLMGSDDQIVICGFDVVQSQGIWDRNQRRWHREAGKLRQADHGAGQGRPQSQSRWCRQRDSGLRQVPSLLRQRMRGVVAVGQTPLGCGLGVVQSQGSEPSALASRSCLASWIWSWRRPRSAAVAGEKLLASARAFSEPRCPFPATSPRACAASYSSAMRGLAAASIFGAWACAQWAAATRSLQMTWGAFSQWQWRAKSCWNRQQLLSGRVAR